jgi:hypothetical protein
MDVGNQPSDQVNHEISDAAMAAVFNLRDIFKRVIDRFDERAPAQQALIKQRQEAVVHVFAKGVIS